MLNNTKLFALLLLTVSDDFSVQLFTQRHYHE